MAFVGTDDKLLDPNQQSQGQGQAQQSPQTQMPMNGGSGGDVVSGTSSGTGSQSQPSQTSGQQSGTGGNGGWTNIQSYINANQGNTGSSDLLQNKVGGQFNTEKNNLDTQATGITQTADAALKPVKDAQTNEGDWLSQAQKNYSYDGTQNEDYKKATDGFKTALGATYSGPNNFSYGISNDTQNYGNALKDDSAFKQLMGDTYQQKAGGQLSGGGRELQSQFDANNQGLADTRQSLMKQYAGLGDYATQKTADTNSALSSDAKQFTDGQGALKDYLGKQATQYETAQQQKENQARNDYNTNLHGSNGLTYTGRNAINQSGDTPINYADVESFVNSPDGKYLGGTGKVPYAGTPAPTDGGKGYTPGAGFGTTPTPPDPGFLYDLPKEQQDAQDLRNFYNQQNAQFQNTGDDEKRGWNAIQDMLGQTSNVKSKGFSVRGQS
jgi:hypothetical protein